MTKIETKGADPSLNPAIEQARQHVARVCALQCEITTLCMCMFGMCVLRQRPVTKVTETGSPSRFRYVNRVRTHAEILKAEHAKAEAHPDRTPAERVRAGQQIVFSQTQIRNTMEEVALMNSTGPTWENVRINRTSKTKVACTQCQQTGGAEGNVILLCSVEVHLPQSHGCVQQGAH